MKVTADPWAIPFITGIVIGSLLIILLITLLKRYSFHVQNITLVMIILVALLFSELIERLGFVVHFKLFHLYSISFDLFMWPFLVYYTQYVIGQRSQYKLKDLVWFLPSFIGLTWNWLFLNTNFFFIDNKEIPDAIAYFVMFKFLVSITFLSYILALLRRKNQMLKELIIHVKGYHPSQKVYYFNLLLLFGILVIYSSFFVNYFQPFTMPDSDDIGSLIVAGILFSFSIMIFRDPQAVDPNKYSLAVKSFFSGDEYVYAKNLQILMMEKEPYLDSEMTSDDLAQQIGLNPQQFSFLLNRYLGVTFSDFINGYRVERMKEKLSENTDSQDNLLQIAYACGFNSKSSMNRIFKNQTGLTPSEFLKKK